MSDIELLKQQLTERGINFKPNASRATLERLLQDADKKDEQDEANESITNLEKEAYKLVRCIITPTDPIKQQMGQEYFGTGNSVLGTISRVIPFGEEWHVERMLLDMIKSKTTQVFINKKDEQGREVVISKTVLAYNVVELPALSKEELEELSKTQQARQSVE